jgi:hypothetical protein
LNRNLNIVTLNVPFPPDYGGMIDTYYRIQSLHDLGIQIHLHCFEYGRSRPKELESLCETISYYPRKSGFFMHISLLPYIVKSRKSELLLDNLSKNDYPILFDGLHSTNYINHPALSNRKILVRVHNIEHKYYRTLAKYEPNLIKKLYFLIESLKLKLYEKVLGKLNCILAISDNDQEYFNKKYHNSVFLAPSHPFDQTESLGGFGKYIIFHGDLSVNENVAITESLILNVFSKVPYLCIVAGKNPPGQLLSVASRYSNIQVVSNPDNKEMTRLILNAHIHLLPALASNGFKLKLLISLYAGRHCLVNSIVGENNSLSCLCHVANSNEEIVEKIHLLMRERFTEEMIVVRNKLLMENFCNLTNAKKLIDFIFAYRI